MDRREDPARMFLYEAGGGIVDDENTALSIGQIILLKMFPLDRKIKFPLVVSDDGDRWIIEDSEENRAYKARVIIMKSDARIVDLVLPPPW